VPQVLIQWGLLDSSAVLCEDLEEIKQSFPHFNLEVRVVFNGEGILTCEQNNNLGNVKFKENAELDLEGKGTCDRNRTSRRKSVRHRKKNIYRTAMRG